MTAMLILNAVLMVLIVAAIVSHLAWSIVAGRARVRWLARRARRPQVRTRPHYGRAPGFSA